MEFDPAFIKLLKAKDKKAQKAFYLQLAPKMYGVCLRYSSDGDDANDIMQEGFIRVFNHIKDFRGDGSLEGWVRRTMVNTAINFYRKRIKRGTNTDLKYVKEKVDDKVYVIEANPRASRTTPFIAKAYQVPFLNIATHAMLGTKKIKDFTI